MQDTSAVAQSVITDQLYLRPCRDPRPDEELLALRTMMRSAGAGTSHLLQRLAEVAMVLCHADGAAVSLQESAPDGRTLYRWVSTTGCAHFLHQRVHDPADSPCNLPLQDGKPVLVDHPSRHYPGFEAPGSGPDELLLLPWSADPELTGTLAIFACDEPTRFDAEDLRKLSSLVEVAMATVRSHALEDRVRQQAVTSASAALANDLAHEINNPLQALANTLFLLDYQHPCAETTSALLQLKRISTLVAAILELNQQSQTPSTQLPLYLESISGSTAAN